MSVKTVPGVAILGAVTPEHAEILTPPAQQFLVTLHRCFNGRRLALLKAREERQRKFDAGQLPDFLPETKAVRDDPSWKGAPPAPGLADRRVEITGPVDRKMVINALNSGASCFMADMEDSHCPTWAGNLDGQANLRDAVRRTATYCPTPGGKLYKLRDETAPGAAPLATLLFRPRGWHLEEGHFVVDGQPASGSLFDFGLYFFHNAKELLSRGSGPYFYLPKMESHLEARLWNDVFNAAQDALGVRRGSVRATVLIETLPAAFEMEEILFELRDHSAGLNCGRWDYIFSFIKKLRSHRQYVLPDRSAVTMASPFMDAYVRLLIQTCHKRGVHAMGGMAAQIPIRDDPSANEAALKKVAADKRREALAGHDGTWVAHPDLVRVAKAVFDELMPGANQLHVRREDVAVSPADLLRVQGIQGTVTEAGLRGNVSVSLAYVEAWLRGVGCLPVHHLMEDAATAEIARSQVWQWVRHGAVTAEGTPVTAELVQRLLQDEVAAARGRLGDRRFGGAQYEAAAQLLAPVLTASSPYPDFLTTLCYPRIMAVANPGAAAAATARPRM